MRIQNYEQVVVSLDKRNDSQSPTVMLRQGDISGTIIKVNITDDGNIINLTGAQAWLEMTTPDDQLFRTSPVTVDAPDSFEVVVDETLAALSTGKYKNAYCRIKDPETGAVASTSSFTVQVIAGSGTDVTSLQDYINARIAEAMAEAGDSYTFKWKIGVSDNQPEPAFLRCAVPIVTLADYNKLNEYQNPSKYFYMKLSPIPLSVAIGNNAAVPVTSLISNPIEFTSPFPVKIPIRAGFPIASNLIDGISIENVNGGRWQIPSATFTPADYLTYGNATAGPPTTSDNYMYGGWGNDKPIYSASNPNPYYADTYTFVNQEFKVEGTSYDGGFITSDPETLSVFILPFNILPNTINTIDQNIVYSSFAAYEVSFGNTTYDFTSLDPNVYPSLSLLPYDIEVMNRPVTEDNPMRIIYKPNLTGYNTLPGQSMADDVVTINNSDIVLEFSMVKG